MTDYRRAQTSLFLMQVALFLVTVGGIITVAGEIWFLVSLFWHQNYHTPALMFGSGLFLVVLSMFFKEWSWYVAPEDWDRS